jgi:hypothetical protein
MLFQINIFPLASTPRHMSFFVSIKTMEMKGSDDVAIVNLILMALWQSVAVLLI